MIVPNIASIYYLFVSISSPTIFRDQFFLLSLFSLSCSVFLPHSFQCVSYVLYEFTLFFPVFSVFSPSFTFLTTVQNFFLIPFSTFITLPPFLRKNHSMIVGSPCCTLASPCLQFKLLNPFADFHEI